jgi:UDP-N-acetylmuramoylalanine-D-glutamate ligase
MARCKAVVLFGALAEMLEEKLAVSREPSAVSTEMPAASRQPPVAQVVRVETLAEAVHAAATLANPGDVVLLSPGGTSYDAFVDFEERGKVFRELVQKLGD